jgi:predicted nucleotidyltransferase
MQYGLSDKVIETLHANFDKYPGVEKVVLYGSRALQNYHAGSDIDISLITDATFTFSDLLHLEGDFEESNLPYFVDVLQFDELKNAKLKMHIERDGKTIYQRSPVFERQYA